MIYAGMGRNRGKTVDEDEALSYAMEQCGVTVDDAAADAAEFKEMLVDWYFSGDWQRVES